MKKFKYKCGNCHIDFESDSKEYQDLCSDKCAIEYEQYLIALENEVNNSL